LVYLGINIAPTFSRRSTHLLCPSGSGAKFDKALEWGVPVVNMGWIEKMATTGILPAASEYQVLSADGMELDALGDEMDVDVLPVHFPKSAKAKGKEKEKEMEEEMDHAIVDITNSKYFFR
jgi:DNA replication regulator DPB11